MKRLFHLIPFVHFYSRWSDTKDCSMHGFQERQQRFCSVCNKKQYRQVGNGL